MPDADADNFKERRRPEVVARKASLEDRVQALEIQVNRLHDLLTKAGLENGTPD